MKHLNHEYKLAIVKYYFKHNETMYAVCKIFNCKKSSLMDWIKQYEQTKSLTRRNRKPISYKISNKQVKTALEILNKNEQTTMDELVYEMKQKYDTFDITPQHLGKIVRDSETAISKVKPENCRNYFHYSYKVKQNIPFIKKQINKNKKTQKLQIVIIHTIKYNVYIYE